MASRLRIKEGLFAIDYTLPLDRPDREFPTRVLDALPSPSNADLMNTRGSPPVDQPPQEVRSEQTGIG